MSYLTVATRPAVRCARSSLASHTLSTLDLHERFFAKLTWCRARWRRNVLETTQQRLQCRNTIVKCCDLWNFTSFAHAESRVAVMVTDHDEREEKTKIFRRP